MISSRNPRIRLLATAASVALLASACGSGDEEAEEPLPTTTEAVDAAAITADQTDITAARAAIDAALERWDTADVASYVLVHQNGAEITEQIVGSPIEPSTDTESTTEPDPTSDTVPVDDLFAEIETALVSIEDGSAVVGDGESCDGQYFAVSFNADLGYPESIDFSTPCDDANPRIYSVTMLEELAEGPEDEDRPDEQEESKLGDDS